jgi:hypothetical protein
MLCSLQVLAGRNVVGQCRVSRQQYAQVDDTITDDGTPSFTALINE